MKKNQERACARLDRATIERLMALMGRVGRRGACRLLGVSPNTLDRLVVGRVRSETAELVRAHLDEIDAQQNPASLGKLP